MKTSINTELYACGASTNSFRPLSTNELVELLPSLYLGLDFDARRARFGGAVSDQSIMRHCRQLNIKEADVFGCVNPTGLLAAIELHPLSPVWEVAELALAERASNDRINILGYLLQLATLAVVKRGCRTLVVSLESSEGELIRLLRGMGRVHVQGDSARVDLGEQRVAMAFSTALL